MGSNGDFRQVFVDATGIDARRQKRIQELRTDLAELMKRFHENQVTENDSDETTHVPDLPFDMCRVLKVFMLPPNCAAFVGDLQERYCAIREKGGRVRAMLWFWRQALISLGPLAWAALKRRWSEKPSVATSKLNLKAIGWSWDTHPMDNRTPYQYVVEELPQGHKAWVANCGGLSDESWRVLQVWNDIQGDWTGDYKSAEEALAALQEATTKSPRQAS